MLRRPRHTLKGRQDAKEVKRARLRLKKLKDQAGSGAIDLLFCDESELSTHPYLFRTWARRGEDLRIEAPGQAQRRAMLGVFDHATHRLVVHVSQKKASADFIALLGRIDAVYGTGGRRRPLHLVLDNGSIHTSKASTAALAARPWITVEWLPKYASELNDIEQQWLHAKRGPLCQRILKTGEELESAIAKAFDDMNGLALGSGSHPN